MGKNNSFVIFLFFIGIVAALIGYFGINRRGDIQGRVLDKFNEKGSGHTLKDSKASALTDEPVVSFNLTGDKVAYVVKNGQVLEVDVNTRVQRIISNNIFLNIFKIIWAPDSRYLIYEISKGSGNRFVFLNLVSGKLWDLDQNIETAAFSPDGSKFAYISRAGETGTVVVHDSDSAEFKVLTTIRIPSIKLIWEKENLIYLQSYSLDGSGVWFELTTDGQLRRAAADDIQTHKDTNKITNEIGGYTITQNESDKKLYLIK